MKNISNSIIKNLGLLILFSLLVFSCIEPDDSVPIFRPVDNLAPEPFDLATPLDFSNFISVQPSLTWNRTTDFDGDPITYSVFMDTTEVPSTVLARNLTDTVQTVIQPLLTGTTYYWRVIATDDRGNSTNSNQIFRFTTDTVINLIPSAFNLLSPESLETQVSRTPTLSWSASSDPEGEAVVYDVFLDQNESPTTLVGENLTAITFDINTPLDEGVYYWRVIAKDPSGNQRLSAIRQFTTLTADDNIPPSEFNLSFPVNMSTGVSIRPIFAWEESIEPQGEAVTYNVYISTDANPNTAISTNLTETNFRPENVLQDNTTYFWRVEAIDASGNFISSAVFNFTTSDEVIEDSRPTDFTLISPQSEAIDVAVQPTFSWDASTDPEGGAIVYDVYVILPGNPDPFKIAEDISDTSFTQNNNLSTNVEYNWFVEAKDLAGNITTSEIRSFTTVSE